MKKIIAIVICIATLFAFCACGAPAEEVAVESSLEILETVWAKYDENHIVPLAGGDYAAAVMDAPAKFDVTQTADFQAILAISADNVKYVDDAASIMHLMNVNVFTCGAFHIADAANQQAFIDGVKEDLSTNQWMCGSPEKLMIAKLGGQYVVSAFGGADNIDYFAEQLKAAYPAVEVVFEENVA